MRFHNIRPAAKIQRRSCLAAAAIVLLAAAAPSQAGPVVSSMDLTMDVPGLPFPVILQLNPAISSPGTLSVTPSFSSPGGYMITSFFDVFTEISLDGGTTWSPSNGGASVNMTESGITLPQITFQNGVSLTPQSATSSSPPTVTDQGSGNYRIQSLFDVFTEISIPVPAFPSSSIYPEAPIRTDVSGSMSLTVSSFPEPATLTLLGIGIVGIAGYGWRRRKPAATA